MQETKVSGCCHGLAPVLWSVAGAECAVVHHALCSMFPLLAASQIPDWNKCCGKVRAQALKHTHAHTHTHARTHAYTQARTHTRAHTQALVHALAEEGLGLCHAIFVHQHVCNMAHFGDVNAVYSQFFPAADPPSRACVQCKQPAFLRANKHSIVMCVFLIALRQCTAGLPASPLGPMERACGVAGFDCSVLGSRACGIGACKAAEPGRSVAGHKCAWCITITGLKGLWQGHVLGQDLVATTGHKGMWCITSACGKGMCCGRIWLQQLVTKACGASQGPVARACVVEGFGCNNWSLRHVASQGPVASACAIELKALWQGHVMSQDLIAATEHKAAVLACKY
eukprot:1159148-Pelagomonas_calceolata.AAC.20